MSLSLNGVIIDDTFAEAFDMAATGVIITAPTLRWARIAGETMTGFATSVIACGAEAAIERELSPDETPDGRPGVRALLFGFASSLLAPQIRDRVGQCVLTCPGAACFAGLKGSKSIPMGAALRYFGDGWQISKRLPDGRRFWRIPVMEGEFLVEDATGAMEGGEGAVGGGNLLFMGESFEATLRAAEAAAEAVRAAPDVIAPFPGGLVRSGSKVGSKYPALRASTNQAYCPTLKGAVDSALTADIACVLEIVIDGLSFGAIQSAMRAALEAACAAGGGKGLLRVGAGNYGGQLGRHHFHLKDLLS